MEVIIAPPVLWSNHLWEDVTEGCSPSPMSFLQAPTGSPFRQHRDKFIQGRTKTVPPRSHRAPKSRQAFELFSL
jgi:hypothetical protein